jgi:prolyl-tRNA editing enzyme YbaK/EbsC (Cys-tRNA(Pro) deacylase)
VDAAVMTRDRIVLGGGSRSWKVIAPPSILLALPGVEVVEGLANPANHANPAPPQDAT